MADEGLAIRIEENIYGERAPLLGAEVAGGKGYNATATDGDGDGGAGNNDGDDGHPAGEARIPVTRQRLFAILCSVWVGPPPLHVPRA